jgi:hypothetical protein
LPRLEKGRHAESNRFTAIDSYPDLLALAGIPTLINPLCDNLLLTCCAMSSKLVTQDMLDEVSRDLRLGPLDNHRSPATAHPSY